jgi:hypothetical protein
MIYWIFIFDGNFLNNYFEKGTGYLIKTENLKNDLMNNIQKRQIRNKNLMV